MAYESQPGLTSVGALGPRRRAPVPPVPSVFTPPPLASVPAGGLAFFSSPGGSGHVMISIGGGYFMSNDIDVAGRIDKTTIATIESRWGHTYLGWAQPYFMANH